MVASLFVYNGQKQLLTLSAFVRVLCEMEYYSYKLSEKAQIKAFQWVEKIVQSMNEAPSNTSRRAQAMAYLLLLLEQVQRRRFMIPFDKVPVVGRPLCPLPTTLRIRPIENLPNMTKQQYKRHIRWSMMLEQLLNGWTLIKTDSFNQQISEPLQTTQNNQEKMKYHIVPEQSLYPQKSNNDCDAIPFKEPQSETCEPRSTTTCFDKGQLASKQSNDINNKVNSQREQFVEQSCVKCRTAHNANAKGVKRVFPEDQSKCSNMCLNAHQARSYSVLPDFPLNNQEQLNCSPVSKTGQSVDFSQNACDVGVEQISHFNRLTRIYRQSSLQKELIERQVSRLLNRLL